MNILVDDCLLAGKPKVEKCDYLFVIKEEKVVYVVECKGSDILKAVNQLRSTLNILSEDLSGFNLKARIISTRVYAPDLLTSSYKNLRKRLNGNLETKNMVCTETI